jgi:hypothetical protein
MCVEFSPWITVIPKQGKQIGSVIKIFEQYLLKHAQLRFI